MKKKDQILLEQAYQKVVFEENEDWKEQVKKDFPMPEGMKLYTYEVLYSYKDKDGKTKYDSRDIAVPNHIVGGKDIRTQYAKSFDEVISRGYYTPQPEKFRMLKEEPADPWEYSFEMSRQRSMASHYDKPGYHGD